MELFIFKSSARGMQYGIGTYIRELTKALLAYTDIIVHLVNYNNNTYKELTIVNVSLRYTEYIVPVPVSMTVAYDQFEKKYATAVVNLISDFIPKSGEIIFQMNYVDDLSIIHKIKEKYSYPVVGIVHFSQWQQLFNGNKQKLNGLNILEPGNNIEYTLHKEKEMYQVIDHIVSVTGYMKDYLVRMYNIEPEKVDVIYNGIDATNYKLATSEEKKMIRHKFGFSPNEKIILFAGRVDQCKGVSFLIDGFCKACESNDNLRLVIVGQGYFWEFLGCYELFYGRITFTGYLPFDRMMEFYQIADIGIVPSVYDHCPYTILEMLTFNIPLIISRIDGLIELLDDTQCVFIDPNEDRSGEITFNKNKISKTILSLCNEERSNLLTKTYHELVNNRFSAKRMAREMHSILKGLNTANISRHSGLKY